MDSGNKMESQFFMPFFCVQVPLAGTALPYDLSAHNGQGGGGMRSEEGGKGSDSRSFPFLCQLPSKWSKGALSSTPPRRRGRPPSTIMLWINHATTCIALICKLRRGKWRNLLHVLTSSPSSLPRPPGPSPSLLHSFSLTVAFRKFASRWMV